MIYLDNAATTKVRPEVVEAMNQFNIDYYGNPSAVYSFARETKKAIDQAKISLSKWFNCDFKDIYFTSGGTESINWAIKGLAYANREKGNHIITTQIEHHATLHTCEYLEKNGFEVTYIPVDAEGKISLKILKEAIKESTILVSLIGVNNEIGTIQPLKEVGKICQKKDILFHIDAVQALGHIPIDVELLGASAISVSAHKVYGPKGIGALYIKPGTKIHPLIHGGAQQNSKRSGTENVSGIVGFGKALELLALDFEAETLRQSELRDFMIEELLKIQGSWLNGPNDAYRVCNNVNVGFSDIENDTLLFLLDMDGIMASSGSSCASGALEASHVLKAIGLEKKQAKESIRLTIGNETTKMDIEALVQSIQKHISDLR